MFFVKLYLHDISWDQGRLVLFLAQLGPVDACEPRVLLDLAHTLRPLGRVFCQQAEQQVAEKELARSVSLNFNQPQVWLVLYPTNEKRFPVSKQQE